MQGEKMLFCCPKCGGDLDAFQGSAVCKSGHTYDKSKFGYYNLLLSNKGGIHGDNKEMILARRAFLGAGHYAPLADRLAALVSEHTPLGGALLDIGCGEGYYTEKMHRALLSKNGFAAVAAFDISKDAARELKKKCPAVECAVASAYSMPVKDGSFATLTNAFSPFAREEIIRALGDGGIFIMAIPEKDHLFELKSILYSTPYKNEVKDSKIEGLSLLYDERLSFTVSLTSSEEIQSLFKMTPYAYRTPPSAAARLLELSSLSVTADFHIYVYRKA